MPSARSSDPQRGPKAGILVFVALVVTLLTPLEGAAQGDDMARAKEAYSRGQELFDAGDFAAAALAFRESLDAFPHYRTLFNIALCEEKLGNLSEAVAMYQRYVDWPAEVPNREEVAAKLETLRAQLPPEPDAPASASTEPDAAGGSATSEVDDHAEAQGEEADGPDLIVPGWVTVGVGAAGLITGGVLIGLAQSKSNQIEKIDGVYYDPDEHDAMQRDGRRYEVGGWVAGGIGAAAVTTGLIMLLVSDRPEPAEPDAEAEPEPEPEIAFGFGCERAALCVSTGWSF